MKLSELKNHIDFALTHGCTGEEEVLITLSSPSVGARASSKARSANPGFDWEHGQFRIEPEKSLRAEGRTLDDPLKTHANKYIYDKCTKLVHHCPNCGNVVKKNYRYCPSCGQHIVIGDRILVTHDYRTKRSNGN